VCVQDTFARIALNNAESAAATFAAPFPPTEPPDSVPWDTNHIPYLDPSEAGNALPPNPSKRDRYDLNVRLLNNQAERAEAHEAHLRAKAVQVAQEQRAAEAQSIRNDPEVIDGIRRQLASRRKPGWFSKASIDARNDPRPITKSIVKSIPSIPPLH